VIPSTWTPYVRESDGELLGYLLRDERGTVPLTLFGYPLAEASEQAAAAQILETSGLAALARRWRLRT